MPDAPVVGTHPVVVGDEELDAVIYRLDQQAPFRSYVLSVLDLTDSDAEEIPEAERLDIGQAHLLALLEGRLVEAKPLPPLGRIRQVRIVSEEHPDHVFVAWIRAVGFRVFAQVGWQDRAVDSSLPIEVKRYFSYLHVFQTQPSNTEP